MKVPSIIIILVLIILHGYGQGFPDLRYSNLSEKDGLSNNHITAVAEDHNGIIWISTNNGLNRYDGYQFTRFYSNFKKSSSLTSNNLLDIMADQRDNLWLRTSTGVICFNTVSEKTRDTKDIHSFNPTNERIETMSLSSDSAHDPCFFTASGIYRITNSDQVRFIRENVQPFNIRGKTFNYYRGVARDKNGQLWAYIQNRIFRVNNITMQVEQTYVCPEDIGIYSIFFDSQNRCWLSTWGNGIYVFNPGENTWTLFSNGQIEHAVAAKPVEWTLNERKYIVFATNFFSLLLVDENNLKSHFYSLGNFDYIGSPVLSDSHNNIWVGTSQGLFYHTSFNNLFDIQKLDQTDVNTHRLDQSSIYAFRHEKSGYWIGRRYEGGISWYDSNWSLIRHWAEVAIDSAYHESMMTKREGFDFLQVGNSMFVTTEWGITVIDLTTFKYECYIPGMKPEPVRLRTIIPKSDHCWWIRSFDHGIYQFDPVTRKFINRYLFRTRVNAVQVTLNYLLKDSCSRIFASSNEGLYQYNSNLDSFLLLSSVGIFSSHVSLGMASDSKGILWIGTDKGLYGYDPSRKTIVKHFDDNAVGSVMRVCVDKSQNIWFNSVSGYWCWQRKIDRLVHFAFDLGLPDNNEGTVVCDSGNKIFAGCSGAIIHFYPDKLMDYHDESKAKILEVFVNDSMRMFHQRTTNATMLDLNAGEDNLRVIFDVINYDLPDNNLYYYRLGAQDAWKQSESGHLSFEHLSPGKYTLEVKGQNKLTGEFTKADGLSFTIHPQWYQSGIFRLIIIFVSVMIVFFLVRLRVVKIRKDSILKQKIAETEMQVLRSQMNPHFIFNCLNSIENYIIKNERWRASEYLNKFARLIRLILINSRDELIPFNKDLEALTLYIELELLRIRKPVHLDIQIEDDLRKGDYRIPPSLIQPYVENAIIHGISQSGKKNSILRLNAFINHGFIHYIVEDNGVGRQKANGI